MTDPILEEIWRVRDQLVKEHGGLKGYLDYIQKLDRARLQRERKKKARARKSATKR